MSEMPDATFVRLQMLQQMDPPVSQRGVVKWGRENLFSGWFSTGLTLLSLLVLYWLVALALPWLLHGVWNASSQVECRAIVAERFGPDASGACWAMIHNRWYQFIFGFFPPTAWWRPVVDFALLFVALAPILYSDNRRTAAILVGTVSVLTVLIMLALEFSDDLVVGTAVLMAGLTLVAYTMTHRLLWLVAIYPFLSVWLLWGGSIWGPVSAAVGFTAVGFVIVYAQRSYGALLSMLVGVVAFLVIFLDPLSTILDLVAIPASWIGGPVTLDFGLILGGHHYSIRDLFPLYSHVSTNLQQWLPFGLAYVESDRFGGFLLAFVIGVSSISISLPIGILFALGRQSNMFLIHALSVGFIEFVRGVPLITMLFVASLLLQYFLPPGNNFDLILRVVILVTLFSAAYIAEVVRGGLASLPKGQYEAANALGLDYWQAQRLIIMPQALKVSIPGIVSTFIGLFKDTTLVAFVGLLDPLLGVTKTIRADIAWKGIYWEPYIFVGAIFFVVCFGMSRYSMYLEGKLKTDHR